MIKFSVGDKIIYIGTEKTLWRKVGIIRYKFSYNTLYNYTAYIVDFEEYYGVTVPDIYFVEHK